MKQQRLRDMAALVEKRGTIRLDELAEHYGVSLITIRRDVDELCAMGRLDKVYGGVKAAEVLRDIIVREFQQRETKLVEEKKKIGRIAAGFVGERDTIFIDAGTTALYVLQYIDNVRMNVVTNNMHAPSMLHDKPNVNLILLGGSYQKVTHCTDGDMTQENLRSFNFTKAFLSPTGASIKNGYTNSFFPEINLKRAILKRAPQSFMLLDHSKWNFSSAITVAPLEAVNTVICDQEPPFQYVEHFEKHKVRLYY